MLTSSLKFSNTFGMSKSKKNCDSSFVNKISNDIYFDYKKSFLTRIDKESMD